MGNWYRVTKTIKGRKYDYWQKTRRIGRSVKTENEYIGPSSASAGPVASIGPGITRLDYVPSPRCAMMQDFIQVLPPEFFAAQQEKQKPGNLRTLQKQQRDMMKESVMEWDRNEYENVQDAIEYARSVRREREAQREVKKRTAGIKAINRFLAQALKK